MRAGDKKPHHFIIRVGRGSAFTFHPAFHFGRASGGCEIEIGYEASSGTSFVFVSGRKCWWRCRLIVRLASGLRQRDKPTKAMAVLAGVVVLVLALMATAFYSKVSNDSPIDAVALSFGAAAPKAEDVYARNALLQSAEKLGAGKLVQSEDLVLDPTGTFLYASTADGWVKKLFLEDGAVEDWQFVGARPLGLALGSGDGEVIVCAAAQGLLKVTKEGVEVLTTEAEGAKFLITDAATVAKDGRIYFTDASMKYGLDVFIHDNLEGRPNGRILVYNPLDKSTQVLLKDLYFPNGIVLSKDESFLIYSETTLARLCKYYLKGEKKGTTEIVNEKLPGFPDNVHWNYEKGILYVGIIGQRDAVVDLLWSLPLAKKLLAVFPGLQAAVDKGKKMAKVLAVDENGNPIKLYQDPTGKVVSFVTTGVEVDGYLYVSGMRDDFVGRVPV